MAIKKLKRPQTKMEEIANAISHGIGVLLALIGIPFLLWKAFESNDAWTFASAIAFSLGMLMVYASSTLYHAVANQKWKALLQKSDHISIYFLIAGTYTPMVLAVLPKEDALPFLGLIWSFVLVGTLFKIFFTGRFKFVSVGLYLLMGWISVFIYDSIIQNLSPENIFWLAAGGLSYTLGVIFYILSNRRYFHTVWHVFVLLGTLSHFIVVYQVL
jgi:hemolysin III